MAKAWPVPSLTLTAPLGLMVPFAPAEAVMVWVVTAARAAISPAFSARL